MIIHNPILTGSFTVNGTDVASITSSAASITAINNYTASQNILNGTYATTGSNTFKNPQTINSNLIVTGSITAQTLVVQTVTSSVIYSSGSNVFGNNIANTQVFTGSMYVTGAFYVTTGSVGLGTITPRTRLQVAGLTGQSIPGTAGIATLGFANSSSVALFTNLDPDYGTLFGTLNTGVGWIQQQRVDGTATAYNLLLQPNGGNVGIGTSNPSYQLDVYAASGYTARFNGATYGGLILASGSTANTYFVGESALLSIEHTTAINLRTNNADRVRITSGGLVGIGTSSPNASYKLTLSGASSGVVAGLALVDTEAYSYSIYSGASALIFRDVTNGAERMRITSGGIGINYAGAMAGAPLGIQTTAAGQQALGIWNTATSGTVYFIEFAAGSSYTPKGSITYNGTNTLYNATSDYRLKKDLKDFNGLEKLSAIKVYDFLWKDTEIRDKGVLAHELAEVLPLAVSGEKDGEKMQGVDYSKIVPVLVKAIQELQAQITELKNK
jgi:hypothetical protein